MCCTFIILFLLSLLGNISPTLTGLTSCTIGAFSTGEFTTVDLLRQMDKSSIIMGRQGSIS